MRAVSRFEYSLLRISQGIVGQTPIEHLLKPLAQPHPRPACLHRDAVELVQEILSKGVVLHLTRAGNWMRRRHLRDGQLAEGNLWQRTAPHDLGLTFSAASLEMLLWLTEAECVRKIPVWVPTHPPQPHSNPSENSYTSGDRLLQYLVASAMASTRMLSHWFSHEPFRSNPLIALAMPDHFAAAHVSPELDFDSSFHDQTPWLMEALQDDLKDWLIRSVRLKSRIVEASEIVAIGANEELVYGKFIRWARSHNRPDLCEFFLQAAAERIDADASPQKWVPAMDVSALRLAERSSAYQSVTALPRAIGQLSDWHRSTLSVGYFDDGYTESQWLKSTWEQYDGQRLSQYAAKMLDEVAIG